MAIKPVEILIKAKDEASGVFGSIGSKLTAVGVAISAYFGINAFVGAVKGAADLQAKLSEVQAVSGATTAEMVLLRKAAEDAGATTKFTATEGAEALGNLARSGLSAKDAIAALPAVLNLAQAGGIGLGEASDYVSKTVMGMGLAFTEAGRVADVLAMGANASNTSVTGLAQALSYAAPLANTLGLDLETTVAIIGKFADAGIDASRAGTALNAIMAQFSDPASKFRTELAGAGITTTNFEQALRQLAAAGPAGSKAINAVGTEAGPALRALLNQGIGALDDLKGKLDGAAGSAAKTAAVMQDNLKGSFDTLSSAWDTVKNTLATPVLPVLKDGVDQLAKAFSDAVGSGVVAKFGESIATAFQAGIKWAQDFAAQIDFTKVAADLRAFADRAGEVFTQIGEYATSAGNSAKVAYGVMSAGTNVVLGAVYLVGEAFAGVASNIQSGLALIMEGFAKVTFGDLSKRWQSAADDMRLSAEATWAASEALSAKSTAAFSRVADSAQIARDGAAGLATVIKDVAGKALSAEPAIDALSDAEIAVGNEAKLADFRINELAYSFENAGNKAKESGDKQQAAATEAKEKVAALRAEYEAAVDSNNWQLAAEKMQALEAAASAAKDGIGDLATKAKEHAAAIAAAFERAGIKTKDTLATAAKTAKEDFDLIKASGQATADGVQAAFKRYADAAIAANGGVASEALKSEAAMRGLEVQTDATGKAIVRAMGEGKRSTDDFTGSVRAASSAVEDQNAALEKSISSREKALDLKKREEDLAYEELWGETKEDSEGRTINMSPSFDTVAEAELYKKQRDENNLRNGVGGASQAAQMVNSMFESEFKAELQAAYNKELTRFVTAAVSQGMSAVSAEQIARDYMTRRSNGYNPGTFSDFMETATAKRTTPQSPNTPSGGTGKTYTVNLNVNGQNTPVNVASEGDAQALISALQRAKTTA